MSGIRLQVTHTGATPSSLVLTDIFDGTDGPAGYKKAGPIYVPTGQTITLVYTSQVASSYGSGVLRGYLNLGYITTRFLGDDPFLEMVGRKVDKIVRVSADEDQGEYLTIKDACDNETTAGTLILIMPGTYEEDPFTVAPSVHLDSWGIDVVTVVAKAANPNTDLITLGTYASVCSLNVSPPANAWGIVVDGPGDTGLIESVVFSNGFGGAHAINGGGIYMRHGLFDGTVSYGLRAEAGSFVGFHGTVNRASVRSLEAIGAGAFVVFSSIAVENCGDAFYVQDGGYLQGQGAYVNTINGALIHTGGGGGTVDVGGVSRTHTVPAALDVQQDTAGGLVSIRGVSLDAERIEAVDFDKISGYGLRSGAGIDPALTIWSALHVGTPGIGREMVTGQGDATTLGVGAFTWDGAAFANLSVAAATEGSPITVFPNVNANTAFYVGWQLDGGFPFHGLEFSNISQIMNLGAGSVVAEYWDGGAWAAFTFMVTEEEPPFAPQAMDVFQNFNGGEHLRFNKGMPPLWAANDPVGLGTNLYWVRFRIAVGITTSPIVDVVKMVPTRTRFDENGLREMDGDARATARLPWSLGEFGKVAGFGTDPTDQNIWVSQNIAIPTVENNFRAGRDSRLTRSGGLPENTDTSTPIRIVWKWCPSNNAAGNVEWTVTWTHVSHGEIYSFANPGVPHPNEQSISVVTAAPGVTRQEAHSDFFLDISGARAQVPGNHGDLLFVTVKRDAGAGLDTYGGDVVVIGVEATYLVYGDGV